MQNELLSHFHGILSGKRRRRTEAGINSIHAREEQAGTSLFAEKLKETFRRSSDNIGFKKYRHDNKRGRVGVSLLRVANLEFKQRMKKMNFQNIPPQLPVRHFSIDGDDDLPPPIPERKCSLDTTVNEDTTEFQDRFVFHCLTTLPLPEEFTNCKKIYPSKTQADHVLQRPPHQPPPPPMDSLPSPTEKYTSMVHEVISSVTLPLTHQTLRSSSNVVNGFRNNNSNCLNKNELSTKPEKPPPPTRPLPPPPLSATKRYLKLSSVRSPVACVAPSETTSSEFSLKQTGLSQPTVPHVKLLTPSPDDNLEVIDSLNQLPTTPHFTPPPPLILIQPGLSQADIKTKLMNGIPNVEPNTDPLQPLTSPSLPAQLVPKYKQRPQLPQKPTKNIQALATNKKLSPLSPPTKNGMVKNGTQTFPTSFRPPSQHQLPLPPKQTSLSQSATSTPVISPLLTHLLPQPDLVSSTYHLNKYRPLPSIPKFPLVNQMLTTNVDNRCEEDEIFHPSKKNEDIYNITDSTDM